MNSTLFKCAIILLVFQACSPSNTKITVNANVVGYKPGDVILFAPLTGVGELDNEQLMQWAAGYVKKEVLNLKVLNYWDGVYKAKQVGIDLPTFDTYDTATFQKLKTALHADLIVVGTLLKLAENYDHELTNPNYQQREAMISLKLIDLKNNVIVWTCTTRVFANPLKIKGKGQNHHTFNISSGNYAISKAYKESIRKLKKSLRVIPKDQ
jgi:hypothetical protein